MINTDDGGLRQFAGLGEQFQKHHGVLEVLPGKRKIEILLDW